MLTAHPALSSFARLRRQQEQGANVKPREYGTHQVGLSDRASGHARPDSLSFPADDSTHMAPRSRGLMAGANDGAAAAGRGSRMQESTGDAEVRAGAKRIAEVAIGGTGAAGAAEHGGERRATVGRVLGRGREAARGAGSDEVDGGNGAAAEVGEVA